MSTKKRIIYYILAIIFSIGMIASIFLPFIKVKNEKNNIADLSFFEYGIYQIQGEKKQNEIEYEAKINQENETVYEIQMVKTIMDRGSKQDNQQIRFIFSFFLSIGFGALFLLFSTLTFIVGSFALNKRCKGAKILAIISTFLSALFILSTYILISTLYSTWFVSAFIYVGLFCSVGATAMLTFLRNENLK